MSWGWTVVWQRIRTSERATRSALCSASFVNWAAFVRCVRPVQPDAPHQAADIGTHLAAAGRLAGAQDGQHAVRRFGTLACANETLGVAAGRVVDVQRHEAALVVKRVEQRQL